MRVQLKASRTVPLRRNLAALGSCAFDRPQRSLLVLRHRLVNRRLLLLGSSMQNLNKPILVTAPPATRCFVGVRVRWNSRHCHQDDGKPDAVRSEA